MTIWDRSTSHFSTSEQISFRHHFLTNYVPTYAHFSMHITLFIQNLLNFVFIKSLSHTLNPACEFFYFATHSSLSTHTLLHLFTLGLKQLSASTLTHVLWYKLLLVARYGDYRKIIKELLYKMKIDVQNKWFLFMV